MDLNTLLAENETVEAAPVDAPAPVAAAVETAPAVEAPAVEAAPDPFAQLGIDPADLAQLAELAPSLRAALEQTQMEPQYVEQQQPMLDPFSDEFGGQLAQLIRQEIQGAVAPLQERAQTEILGEAESRAMDILHADTSQHGEFLGGDQVLQAARAYAEQLMPDFQQRYGFGPRAAEAALTASAQHFRTMEQQISEAAVERYKNQLSTLANAPQEAGAATAGTVAPGEYKDEMAAFAAWASRNAAA